MSKSTTEQANTLPTQETYALPANNLLKESTDGLNCKNVANAVAQNNQARTGNMTSVLQSHFSKTDNKCYYELSINLPPATGFTSSVSTEIRVAPDDDWIAECSSGVYTPPTLFCTQHNVGAITEQQFKQLKDVYFKN